jgi:hypothetical protein
VIEETGLKRPKIVKSLGVVTRPATEKTGEVVSKDIHMYLMEVDDFTQGEADEETVWMDLDDAMKNLFPQEADFLAKIASDISNKTAQSV